MTLPNNTTPDNTTPDILTSGKTLELCGCSFVRPGLSLHDGLKWVSRHGFKHVDIGIGGAHAHYDPCDVARHPEAFSMAVRNHAQDFELQPNECFLLNFGWPVNSPVLEEQKQTLHLFSGICRFAVAAGFSSVLLIPGPVHPSMGPEQSLDLAIAALSPMAAMAADHGLRLHVEADCESCANTPETALELCQRTSQLYLTLDYSHFVFQGIRAERVEPLHAYTRHLHIRQAAPGQLVAPADQGSLDYASIIGQLQASGYHGLLSVEYLDIDNTPESLAQTQTDTQKMIDQLLAFELVKNL